MRGWSQNSPKGREGSFYSVSQPQPPFIPSKKEARSFLRPNTQVWPNRKGESASELWASGPQVTAQLHFTQPKPHNPRHTVLEHAQLHTTLQDRATATGPTTQPN